MVLNLLSSEEHKSYGKTILTVLEGMQYKKSTLTLIGIIDDKDGLK